MRCDFPFARQGAPRRGSISDKERTLNFASPSTAQRSEGPSLHKYA